MICFLTSRTDLPDSDHLLLNPANGFIDRLRRVFPARCRVLAVSSDPDNWERTDLYAHAQRTSLQRAGLICGQFLTLDGRNEAEAARLVKEADLLILCGGHVPTQNRFFQRIGLKDLLGGFDGVLIGVSAGSMNSAETVYAQPELEGEAVDPAYQRFLPGLGLTEKMILPHYQEIRCAVLDGLRVMEDIAFPDSLGRRFYLLPDGSYLHIEDGREQICGEAYLLADGILTPLCAPGQTVAV